MFPLSRRNFFTLAGASLAYFGARPLRAVEPFGRTGGARLRLSLAAYSFRDYFTFSTKKQKPVTGGRRITIPEFIDIAAEHGAAGVELTSYYFPEDVSAQTLLDTRRYAFLKGLAVSGTSVGNNFALPAGEKLQKEIADVKKWIDNAALLGAPHIRIFAGAAAKGLDAAEARRMCISAIEECCDYAGKHGIFLGLENHGGIVAEPDQLLEIIRTVKSPWLGINLDSANFRIADPYAGLEKCAPYAVNVQIKTDVHRSQKQTEPADVPRIVEILKKANYQGWVALEYEGAEDTWTAVPKYMGQLRELLGTGAPSASAGAWMPLFDGKSLAGWKPAGFSGAADVTVQNGALVLEAGNDITGVNLTGEVPKTNYEVSLEAQRQSGSDFFCALTAPVKDSFVTLVVGGWGGAVVGISNVDGNDASENETTQFRKFEDNRWYKIRLKVTDDKLEAYIDDERLVNLELKDKRLELRAGEIELSKPFGIATYRTRGALREIKMRRV